jgi:hypothetical protein
MLRIMPWKWVIPTQDQRALRREKRTQVQVDRDRYAIRDELARAMGASWLSTKQIFSSLSHRFPGDITDALRFFEGTVFERGRHSRWVTWRVIPGAALAPRPATGRHVPPKR